MDIPVWDIPSYPSYCSSDEFQHSLRVATDSGIGFIPFDDNDYFDTHVRFETDSMSSPTKRIMAPPRYIDVDFEGLGGDFAGWNGSHVIEFLDVLCPSVRGLQYGKGSAYEYSPGSYVWTGVRLSWEATDWTLSLVTDYYCSTTFDRDPDQHSPYGTYSIVSAGCTDGGCSDSDTCYKSQGATCTVSEH